MSKFLYLFSIFMLSCSLACNVAYSGEVLTGGVIQSGFAQVEPLPVKLKSITVQEARQEAFKAVVYRIDTTPFKMYANKIPNGVVKHYSDGEVSVREDKMFYCYNSSGRLYQIGYSNKSIGSYPSIMQRYNAITGILEEISYASSNKDCIIFNAKGQLTAHWVNDVDIMSGIKTIKNTYY